MAGLLAVLLVAVLADRPAFAIEPPYATPMGIPAKQADNALPGYQAPLAGSYYLRQFFPPGGVEWDVAPGLALPASVAQNQNLVNWTPPTVSDPIAGQAIVLPLPAPNPNPADAGQAGYWATLQGTIPGWVTVSCKHLLTQAVVLEYYRLYEILILEDQLGGAVPAAAPPNTSARLGFDPRYASSWSTWFSELGGYHFKLTEPEPGAEEIFGYNDNMATTNPLLSSEWTGMPLNPPGTGRTPVWRPEAQLLPSTVQEQGMPTGWRRDSLLATPRDNQHVGVYLHGPRENGFEVPVFLHCKSVANGGIVDPGVPQQVADYDIQIRGRQDGGQQWRAFLPPAPYPQLPGTGEWIWPAATTIRGPQVAIRRGVPWNTQPSTVDDPQQEARKRRWILRVPWTGWVQPGNPLMRGLSGAYGDIEVEARIPPHGWPSGLATLYGADPLGHLEGIMQLRFGTVVELKRIGLRAYSPPEPQIQSLKSKWYRRVQSETRNVLIPPDRLTLSLGMKVVDGGTYAGRQADEARLSVISTFGESSGAGATDLGEPYFKEVTLTGVNRKVAVAPDPEHPVEWGGSYLVEGAYPDDILGSPWFNGAGQPIQPDSLRLEVRGYVGAIPKNPYVGDYDAEPAEFEPTLPKKSEQIEFVHFLNVLADVNNDGQLNALDDDDETEEGTANEPGLIICRQTAGVLIDPDPNRKEFKLRLSRPLDSTAPTATGSEPFTYAGHEIWIRASGVPSASQASLRFVTQTGATLAPDPTHGVFRVTGLPWQGAQGGVPSSVWLTVLPTWQHSGCTLQFFLVRWEDRDGTAVPVRIALDEVKTTTPWLGLRMDSENDGDIDEADESVESQFPGHLMLFAPTEVVAPSDAILYREHVTLADNHKLRIRRMSNLLEVKLGSKIILSGTATSYEFDEDDLQGSAPLQLSVSAKAKGSAVLMLEYSCGDVELAADIVFVSMVARDLDYTSDPHWHAAASGKFYFNGPGYTAAKKFEYTLEGATATEVRFDIVGSSDNAYYEALPLANVAQFTDLPFSGKLSGSGGAGGQSTGLETSEYLPCGSYRARVYFVPENQPDRKLFQVDKAFECRSRRVYWLNAAEGLPITDNKWIAMNEVGFDPARYGGDPLSATEVLIMENGTSAKWVDAWGWCTREGLMWSADHGVTSSYPDGVYWRGTHGLTGLGTGTGGGRTLYSGWNAGVFAAGGWDPASGLTLPGTLTIAVQELREFDVELAHCYSGNYRQNAVPWPLAAGVNPADGPQIAGHRLMDSLGEIVGQGNGSGSVAGYVGEYNMQGQIMRPEFDFLIEGVVTQEDADAAAEAGDAAIISGGAAALWTLDQGNPANTATRWYAAARAVLDAEGYSVAVQNSLYLKPHEDHGYAWPIVTMVVSDVAIQARTQEAYN